MRRVEFVGVLVVGLLAAPAFAQKLEPAPGPTRAARLLAEGAAVATAGVAVPLGAFGAFTLGLQSFTGFFAGFLSASLVGLVVAPIAVVLMGRFFGAQGREGWAVLGAIVGLVIGLFPGLLLATLPSAAYVLGLALLWVMPSVGAMVAFEWGREPPRADGTGLTLARF